VKIRPIHLLHSAAALAVATQLAFASLFLVDCLQTSASYDALAANRVPVLAHRVACYGPSVNHFQGYFVNCLVAYRYRGQQFHAWSNKNWGLTYYVDPRNTAFRMSKVTYDNATTNINSDVVFSVLLFLGAALVTVVHQLHLYRRRQRHRLLTTHHFDQVPHRHTLAETGSAERRP
jgi:hypothetical protein